MRMFSNRSLVVPVLLLGLALVPGRAEAQGVPDFIIIFPGARFSRSFLFWRLIRGIVLQQPNCIFPMIAAGGGELIQDNLLFCF